MTTRCHEVQDAILVGDTTAFVRAHVASCAECREVLGDVHAFERLVHAARREPLGPRRPAAAIVVPVPRRAPAYWKGASAIAAMALVAVGVWSLALHDRAPATTARQERGGAAAAPVPIPIPVPAPVPAPIPAPAPAPRRAPIRAPVPAPARIPPAATAEVATTAPEPTAADLRAVVLAESGRMQACYEEALRLDPTLGTVATTVTVSVNAGGRVTRVETAGSIPSMVRRCVGAAIRPLVFPESADGLEVAVPLRFEMRASP